MKTLSLILVVLCLFVMPASATSIDPTVPPSVQNSLWSSIDLPGFSFRYGTSTANGKTNFDAGMTNEDRISSISISVSRDGRDLNHGWIYANFNGVVGDIPVAMDYRSQSMNVNRRGVRYSSDVGLSSYPEVVSWPTDKDSEPIYGDWLSTGHASMTLFDVTPTWANMDYSEYTDKWFGHHVLQRKRPMAGGFQLHRHHAIGTDGHRHGDICA